MTVSPTGEDGLRFREIVDQDFGDDVPTRLPARIPNDFGAPTDVSPPRPDAPDDLGVVPVRRGRPIRMGDPESPSPVSIATSWPTRTRGPAQHGTLGLDMIGDRDAGTSASRSSSRGSSWRIRCAASGAWATTAAASSNAGEAVSSRDRAPRRRRGRHDRGHHRRRSEPIDVPVPVLPERRTESNRALLAIALLPLGAVTGGPVYAGPAVAGSNEVSAGGAADAAFGDGPLRRPGSRCRHPVPRRRRRADPSTTGVRLVADQDMANLATTEFVPPAGIDPWLGAVVLRETIDNDTVSAWFSGLAARDILALERSGDKGATITLRRGAQVRRAEPEDAALDPASLRRRRRDRARLVRQVVRRRLAVIRNRQRNCRSHSGYWKRPPPAAVGASGSNLGALLLIGVFVMLVGGTSISPPPSASSRTRSWRWCSASPSRPPPPSPPTARSCRHGAPSGRPWPYAPSRSAASLPPARVATSSGPGSTGCCGSTRHGPWRWAPPTRGSARSRARACHRPSTSAGRCSSTAWPARSTAPARRPPAPDPAGSGGFSGGSVGGGGGGGSSGSW